MKKIALLKMLITLSLSFSLSATALENNTIETQYQELVNYSQFTSDILQRKVLERETYIKNIQLFLNGKKFVAGDIFSFKFKNNNSLEVYPNNFDSFAWLSKKDKQILIKQIVDTLQASKYNELIDVSDLYTATLFFDKKTINKHLLLDINQKTIDEIKNNYFNYEEYLNKQTSEKLIQLQKEPHYKKYVKELENFHYNLQKFFETQYTSWEKK